MDEDNKKKPLTDEDDENLETPVQDEEEIKDEENNDEDQNEDVENVNEEHLGDAVSNAIRSGIVGGISNVEVSDEVRSAFLDYSMSVIVSRALPDVRDGFKPVHRRIIYGMNEVGMTPDKPYKKSARIVGDVMGKYHPHGDSAIYSTLVRLAQPFSMRYPLVDGHGNFGSVDGDEAAAMRYTEARLSKIALEMVRDIDQDTVDFMDNYDGTEKEPQVLPSRFPNLLVNGSSGIAVGMATNIPPHNLREVINAVIAIAHDPELSPLEIMTTYLFGPDFPTGGIILGKGGIRKAYETGQGSVVIRSKAHFEELDNGKHRIVVTEIPYIVNKATMIENIANLVKDKVIEGITDIRDESNKEGIRVVIELRRDVIPEVILNQLFKNTQLQTSFGIIMLCLVNNAPKVLPINEVLKEYLNYQIEIIGRRTNHQLQVAMARNHLVQGLLQAINHIDEIVKIIKDSSSPDEATSALIGQFGFSELQTKEILSLTLRRLTGLEEQKLENERNGLEANIAKFQHILESRDNIQEVVISELEEIKAKYGDDRRTELSNDLASIDDEDLIPVEDVIISLTKNGYIKRLSPDTFRTQHRGGRGIKGMATQEDDVVDIIIHTITHSDVLFFTNRGKVYRLRGYQVPEFSRTSKGIPVQNLLQLEKDEKVRSIISLDSANIGEGDHLFFATVNGTIKRTSIAEFASIRQNGKIAISLADGDELLAVKHTNGEAEIALASSKGKLCRFKESDVRSIGRNAMGVKGMDVDGGKLVGFTTSLEGEYILSVTSRGYGKMSPLVDYRETKRGAKGVITINATEKNGELVGIRAVHGNEDLIIITEAGIVIRISLEQVARTGRNTQGVRIIRLEDNEALSSFAVVDPSDEEEVEEVEE
ncbi:MAG: DNA gyrase subunit A [Bacilli bacterium]|jgi:DNA gyrase subunit A|nr:DNA gyrase subunit A [Bacilli bacterium]